MIVLFMTKPKRGLGGLTVGDNTLSSDWGYLHPLPMPGSRVTFRAWPCGLLAPNLYVSGETHCSVLPTVPHWMNTHPFWEPVPFIIPFHHISREIILLAPVPPIPGPC